MTVVALSEKPNPDQMLAHLQHLFGGFLDGVHDGLVELAWTVNGDKPTNASKKWSWLVGRAFSPLPYYRLWADSQRFGK